MSFLSSKNNGKAMAGRDLLKMAFGGPGGGGFFGGTPDNSPAKGAPGVPPGTAVRIHGVLDKPAGASYFKGEDWQPRYFVLRSDFVLEYYSVPPAGVQPPPWHHGLAPYEGVVQHLGQARGIYPLEQLAVKQARAEGPRLHIYLSKDVRFGGKDCRELQLRACADDRARGVPHATAVIQHWAQALGELADQAERAHARGGQLGGGGSGGSPNRFSGAGAAGQWGSPMQTQQSQMQSPMQSQSPTQQPQWGSQSPMQTQQSQQWGQSPMQSRYPGEIGGASPASAPVPRDASRSSWTSQGLPPPQNSMSSIRSHRSDRSEGDPRRVQELEDRNAYLEQRLREMASQQQGFGHNGGVPLPPPPPPASSFHQPLYQRSPTLEALRQQRPQQMQQAPSPLQRSSAPYP